MFFLIYRPRGAHLFLISRVTCGWAMTLDLPELIFLGGVYYHLTNYLFCCLFFKLSDLLQLLYHEDIHTAPWSPWTGTRLSAPTCQPNDQAILEGDLLTPSLWVFQLQPQIAFAETSLSHCVLSCIPDSQKPWEILLLVLEASAFWGCYIARDS